MRKIIRTTVILLAWLGVALGAVAANYTQDTYFRIYCEDFSMPISGEKTITLLLDNPSWGELRRSFQVDVTLPSGYQPVEENGHYATMASGFRLHDHYFADKNMVRLVVCADEYVPPMQGREFALMRIKQVNRTLTATSQMQFANFIYVKNPGSNGHFGAEVSVTLTPYIYANSVTLNKNTIEMFYNDSCQLSATVKPSTSPTTVEWTSSDTSVATVDDTGLVTTHQLGTATITAKTTDGTNLSASCQVTSTGITEFAINKSSMSIFAGESEQLSTTVKPTVASSLPVTWSSSDAAIASVDANGVVKAHKVGSATITATSTATTSSGTTMSASCVVTVTGATSFTLDQTNVTLYAGETLTLLPTIKPDRCSSMELVWKSSNSNVATVSAKGVITALKEGETKITATTTDGSELSATCAVTVKGAERLTLDKTSLVLFVGETARLTATVTPDRAAGKSLAWSSSDSSIASVTTSGLVTSKAVGTATITVTTTDGTNRTDRCMVTVTPEYTLLVDTLMHIRGTERAPRTVDVQLVNRNAISGVQFDMTLPNYVTMCYSDGFPDIWLDDGRKARNQSVDINSLGSTKYYRVLVSSPTNKTFSGQSGAILHFNVLIDQYPSKTGNGSIYLSNIELSEADETKHTISGVSGNVKYGYLVGDANADTKVDVSDYVLTANYIMQRSVSNFWSDAANAAYSDDNAITVTDLVGIVNIALEKRDREVRPAPAIRGDLGEMSLSLSERALDDGNATLYITLDNGVPVAALQADVTLPEGVTLVETKTMGRAAGYAVESATLADGRIRLLLSQFSDATIAAGEGDIITLTLAGKAVDEAMVAISDIIAAERNLTAHYPAMVTMQLTNLTGMADIAAEQPRIYVEDGAVAIDSPTDGMATIATVDGRSMTVEVKAGHNVYSVPGHGVYIVYLNGAVAKLGI